MYSSCPFDAGADNAWQTLSWDETQTMNTTLSVKARNSPDGATWNDWSDLSNSGDNISHPDRWLQYQLILGTGDTNETPLVNSVDRTFGSAQADLSVVKAASANTIGAGGVLRYFLNVRNNGPDPAASVTITDTLPAGINNVDASGAGWNCSTPTSTLVSCSSANLPVGSAPGITITLNAPAEEGVITNTATASSATIDPVTTNNTSNKVAPTVTAQADLSIVKSGPADVNAGGVFSYTLNVSNAGRSTASSLTVTDTLSAGVANASASGTGWTCGVASGLVTCTRPSLGVTSSPAITILATAPSEGGSIHNKASVSSATADPVTTNNTSNTVDTTVTAQADLSINGTGSSQSVKMGGLKTYTLTVNNSGPSTGDNVKIFYILPGGASFASALGTGWNCNLNAGEVSCSLQGDLATGAASPLMIRVHAPLQGGPFTNTFSVSSDTPDPNHANDSKEITSTVKFGIFMPIVMK